MKKNKIEHEKLKEKNTIENKIENEMILKMIKIQLYSSNEN